MSYPDWYWLIDFGYVIILHPQCIGYLLHLISVLIIPLYGALHWTLVRPTCCEGLRDKFFIVAGFEYFLSRWENWYFIKPWCGYHIVVYSYCGQAATMSVVNSLDLSWLHVENVRNFKVTCFSVNYTTSRAAVDYSVVFPSMQWNRVFVVLEIVDWHAKTCTDSTHY